MLTLDQILSKLREINDSGYVKTHQSGNAGIGRTLEDLVGIEENNFPSSNGHLIELKSGRKNAKSMLSLFTKSPLPDSANTILLNRYGYPPKKGKSKRVLHTTVFSTVFRNLKGKLTFKTEVKSDRIELINTSYEVLGFWTKDVLKESFERKLPEVLYVKADTKGKGANEEFWYNEAWLLSGLNFDSYLKLLSEDRIKTDIRIGQWPDGSPHDHGTGFRVLQKDLDLCFERRKQLI